MSECDGCPTSLSCEHGTRRRVTLGLVVTVLWFAALTASGHAQTVIANWPHSPLNHVRGTSVKETNPSFAVNLRGNFVTASNTLLTCPGNPVTRRQRAARRRQGRAAEPCEGAQQQRREHASTSTSTGPAASTSTPAGPR